MQEFQGVVANPRTLRSGGWFSFTLPLEEDVDPRDIVLDAEGVAAPKVERRVAPRVYKCWAYAPLIDTHEHLSFNVFAYTNGDHVTIDPRIKPEVQHRIVCNGNRVALISGQSVRIPDTQLVVDYWCDGPSASIREWELLVTCSDSSTTDMDQQIDHLYIESPTNRPMTVYDAAAVGAKGVGHFDGWWRWQLLADTSIADGQAQAWHGSVIQYAEGDVDMNAAGMLEARLEAMVEPSHWRDHWGPFRTLPTVHPDSGDGIYPAALRRYPDWVAETAPGPWDAPRIGMGLETDDTGDQEDFGATSCQVILNGGPLALIESRMCAMAEARRRGYAREADGSIVRQENHSDLVYWGQYVHPHPVVSPDRLGKVVGDQPRTTHGWEGWDNEHVSINRLCGTYLLTGSRVLGRLIEHSVESWLLGATTKLGWSTNDRGEPRSVGRTLLAMAWAYHCTGDERIPERMKARIESSYQDLLREPEEGELYVIKVHPRDNRYFDGKHRFWMPWQEALAIVGLDAAVRVTGSPDFRHIRDHALRNWIRYGWWQEEGGLEWVTGAAVAVMEPGKPPSYPGENSKPHWGTDFDIWALGALRIAADILRGSPDGERAAEILASVEGKARREQRGYWRAGVWGATR